MLLHMPAAITREEICLWPEHRPSLELSMCYIGFVFPPFKLLQGPMLISLKMSFLFFGNDYLPKAFSILNVCTITDMA